MIIQHNMQAMNANRMLGNIVTSQSKSTEKLSSGYRINRAGDDAAGLAISEKMRGQIRGLTQASTNAQDGISLIQTAEGALTETHSILQRMRELAVQASNDTNTDDDRTQIQNEIDQLTQEVNRIATTTEFNTKKLLDGSRVGSISEKAGSIGLDSTFSNSNVSAIVTIDGSEKASFTDVIRIEVTKDFEEGQSTAGEVKLSDNAITDIYTVLVGDGDGKPADGNGSTLTSDEFKLEMNIKGDDTYKPNTQMGTLATAVDARNSLDEAIKTALAAEKAELSKVKSAETTAVGAVDLNEDILEAQFEKIARYDTVIEDLNTSTATDKTGIFADGVTVDKVKEVFEKYVALLVEDGTLAGTDANGTDKSNATSIDIIAMESELKTLFATTETATLSAAPTGGGANYNFSKIVTANGEAATGLADIKDDAAYATTTAVGKVAEDVFNDLLTVAKQVAGTKVEASKYASDVAKQQKLVDTLSDTELTKAIYNYKDAEATLAGMTKTTHTEDAIAKQTAKVAEYKAELDKLNISEGVLRVTDLFGNGEAGKEFIIGSNVDDKGNLTITLKNNSDTDTVITVSNADQLKAGDILTVTTGAMVESKEAAVGEEALRLQAGANAGQEISLGINSMRAVDLNIVQTKEGVEGEALDVTSQANASLAIKAYDLAIQKVSTERAKMGATQNRLEHTISNLDTSAENLQAAESRIRDVDMAEEMTTYSKNNILQQAAQSMLAQANQSTQGVLSLLQ